MKSPMCKTARKSMRVKVRRRRSVKRNRIGKGKDRAVRAGEVG
jgi:hypothetical protein